MKELLPKLENELDYKIKLENEKKTILNGQKDYLNSIEEKDKLENEVKNVTEELSKVKNELGLRQEKLKVILDNVIGLEFEEVKKKLAEEKISILELLEFVVDVIRGKAENIKVDENYISEAEKFKDEISKKAFEELQQEQEERKSRKI